MLVVAETIEKEKKEGMEKREGEILEQKGQ